MKISDLHLPEHSITNIISILKANQMPPIVPEEDKSFNCWAWTSFYCGWIKKVYWMDRHEMEDNLTNFTESIDSSEVQAGDIAVFRSGSMLMHTAVLLPDLQTVYHKPGANQLCIDTLKRVAASYGKVSYVRALEKDEETA